MRIVVASVVGLMLVVASASAAHAAFRISPDVIDSQVKIGRNSLPPVTVGNESSVAQDFVVQLAGYGQGPAGDTQVLDQDTNSLSATAYITPSALKLHVEPGASQKVQLDAVIPDGASGGRYAVLLLVTETTGQGGVNTISRLGVPIRLTISGSTFVKQGTVTIRPPAAEPGKPVSLNANYQNTGNFHYKIQAEFTIYGQDGTALGRSATGFTMVLPGYSRDLVSDWTAQAAPLVPGSYKATVRVTAEDGAALSEASVHFDVPGAVLLSNTPAPRVNPAAILEPTTSAGARVTSSRGKTNWSLIMVGAAVLAALGVGTYLVGVNRGRRGH